MSDFDNIGKLMHLPITDIELTTEIKESNSLISIAAESILKSNGRNWIPVIVIEVADYQYQVVSNQLVYAAAREAKLDRVWCIVIDHAPETLDQISILNKESNPIVNLCTAPKETIEDALLLLLGRQDAVTLRRVNLKQINLLKLVDQIVSTDSNREQWSSISELMKLDDQITEKQLNIFRQVFYCTPTQNRLKPEPICLVEVSLSQIVKRVDYLYKQDNCEIKQIDLDLLSNLIYQRSGIDDNWDELVKNLKNDCIDCSIRIDGNQIDKLKEFFFYDLV